MWALLLQPVLFPIQVYQVENLCPEEVPMEHQECVHVITQTPTPPTLSPPALPLGSGEELPVDHIMQGKNNNIALYYLWDLCTQPDPKSINGYGYLSEAFFLFIFTEIHVFLAKNLTYNQAFVKCFNGLASAASMSYNIASCRKQFTVKFRDLQNVSVVYPKGKVSIPCFAASVYKRSEVSD